MLVFGHCVHSGIYWRSDTDSSVLPGEALAISSLQDQSARYQREVHGHIYEAGRDDGNDLTLTILLFLTGWPMGRPFFSCLGKFRGNGLAGMS